MRRLTSLIAAVLLIAAWSAVARAQAPSQSTLHQRSDRTADMAAGFRIGGWGFRNTEEGSDGRWDDCPMSGFGVWGERHVTNSLFVEAGADIYFTKEDQAVAAADRMDRISGLITLAGGARSRPFWRMRGHVQAGVGLERTRVQMPMAPGGAGTEQSQSFTLPVGFVGFGGDVRLTGSLRLGADFRALVMGHFDHPAPEQQLSSDHEVAMQAQFGLAYSL